MNVSIIIIISTIISRGSRVDPSIGWVLGNTNPHIIDSPSPVGVFFLNVLIFGSLLKQQTPLVFFCKKTIVFTGTRDKTLEIFIENSGGKVSTSVSKKTSIVVHSDNPDSSNAKYVKAKELNVKLMSISEFKKKYQK